MKRHFRRLSPPVSHSASRAALRRVLSTDAWLRGRAVERFERKLAELAGVAPEQVVSTATCTDALAAAGLVLLGQTPGAQLKVCPMTYAGTYSWFGPYALQSPTWVDCDEDGWPVAPVDVAVDLWGRRSPSGSGTILDAAHRFRPDEVPFIFEGGWFKAVCWSFGPQKELPGVRGGAAVFATIEPAEKARAFLNNGIGESGPTGAPGRKGYMSNIDAAFLERQLDALPTWRKHRQQALEAYARFFPPSSPVAELLTLPGEASGHLAVLRFANRGMRDRARTTLQYDRIETSVHYPVPPDAPPGCQELSGRILSVPCHPQLQFADVRRIANRIIRAT